MDDSVGHSWESWAEVAMRIGLPLALGMAGWAHMQLWDHSTRLTRIEAVAYTQAQASRDREAQESLLRDIRETLGTINDRLARVETRLEGR